MLVLGVVDVGRDVFDKCWCCRGVGNAFVGGVGVGAVSTLKPFVPDTASLKFDHFPFSRVRGAIKMF